MTFVRSPDGAIMSTSAPYWLYQLLARASLGRVVLGPEDRECITFADRLRVWSLEGRLRGTWTHIPHEVGGGKGKGSEVRYAVAKALGLVTGSGDYVFVAEGFGGWIEFKAPKRASPTRPGKTISAGKLNPEQVQFQQWCERTASPYRIAHTADEGEAILREWGLLL